MREPDDAGADFSPGVERQEKDFDYLRELAGRDVSEFERRQGWIAQAIVGLFVGVVIALVAAYLLAALVPSAERITAGADKASELIRTLLLPIVTLVLGYYFGKRAD